jgi:4-hydroxy-tetrahydrodipicolinate synthase
VNFFSQRQSLRGIVPPLVTPLLSFDTLDVAGTIRLVEHVIDGGVAGVFILGTTGEAPSLSYRLRRKLIELVCSTVQERVPVMVGITDTAFVESVELSKSAAACGASALVLTTPYYFPAGQTELLQYVEHILPLLPLPLMLYNMPALTKVWFDIETIERVCHYPQIVGVKDSSGDMAYFERLLKFKEQRPDWTIMIGPEHLTAEAVRLGADGGVNGGANVLPRLFSSLFAAAAAGDAPRVAELQSQVDRLQAIYAIGKYASRFIKATKCALSLRGICDDHMAEPFNHFYPAERAKVQAILETLA